MNRKILKLIDVDSFVILLIILSNALYCLYDEKVNNCVVAAFLLF